MAEYRVQASTLVSIVDTEIPSGGDVIRNRVMTGTVPIPDLSTVPELAGVTAPTYRWEWVVRSYLDNDVPGPSHTWDAVLDGTDLGLMPTATYTGVEATLTTPAVLEPEGDRDVVVEFTSSPVAYGYLHWWSQLAPTPWTEPPPYYYDTLPEALGLALWYVVEWVTVRPCLRNRQSPLWVPSRNSTTYSLRNRQTPYL